MEYYGNVLNSKNLDLKEVRWFQCFSEISRRILEFYAKILRSKKIEIYEIEVNVFEKAC